MIRIIILKTFVMLKKILKLEEIESVDHIAGRAMTAFQEIFAKYRLEDMYTRGIMVIKNSEQNKSTVHAKVLY